MSLDDLRKKIDEIDARLVELIGQRIKTAEEIGQGKKKTVPAYRGQGKRA